jgi:ankyrin repeat protein
VQHCLLKGLGKGQELAITQATSLGSFLELYRFQTPTDNQQYADAKSSMVGQTPLYYAAMAGNIPVLAQLLALPAVVAKINLRVKKIAKSDRYGSMGWANMTPLLAAAFTSESPAALQLLIEHGANTLSTCSVELFPGCTALHMMAFSHSNECLAWWLNQNFAGVAGDVNWLSDSGTGVSPMGQAIILGAGNSTQTVKLLIHYGANINTDGTGQQMLTKAAVAGDIDVMRMLISVKGQEALDQVHIPNVVTDPFLRIVFGGVQLVFHCGGAKKFWIYQMATTKGSTAMCCAAVCCSYAVAKELLLLTHPPDLNHKVAIGHTALTQAQRWGFTSIINLLSAAETENSKHARS